MLTPTYIFDMNRLFREGTRLILNAASFEIVGMAEYASDLHDLPKSESPPLFIVGNIADAALADFISMVISAEPKARIVVLANTYDQNEAAAVFSAGAKGYLHKGLSADSFVKALQLISEECSVVSGWPMSSGMGREAAALSGMLPTGKPRSQLRHAKGSSPLALDRAPSGHDAISVNNNRLLQPLIEIESASHKNFKQLSPREKAILKLVMGGESNKQIARRLNITESTVKVHVKTIFRKIDAKNRTQAAMWAMAAPGFAELEHHYG